MKGRGQSIEIRQRSKRLVRKLIFVLYPTRQSKKQRFHAVVVTAARAAAMAEKEHTTLLPFLPYVHDWVVARFGMSAEERALQPPLMPPHDFLSRALVVFVGDVVFFVLMLTCIMPIYERVRYGSKYKRFGRISDEENELWIGSPSFKQLPTILEDGEGAGDTADPHSETRTAAEPSPPQPGHTSDSAAQQAAQQTTQQTTQLSSPPLCASGRGLCSLGVIPAARSSPPPPPSSSSSPGTHASTGSPPSRTPSATPSPARKWACVEAEAALVTTEASAARAGRVPSKQRVPDNFAGAPRTPGGSPPQRCRTPERGALPSHVPPELSDLLEKGLVKRQFRALSQATPAAAAPTRQLASAPTRMPTASHAWVPQPITPRVFGMSPRRLGPPVALPPASQLPAPLNWRASKSAHITVIAPVVSEASSSRRKAAIEAGEAAIAEAAGHHDLQAESPLLPRPLERSSSTATIAAANKVAQLDASQAPAALPAPSPDHGGSEELVG